MYDVTVFFESIPKHLFDSAIRRFPLMTTFVEGCNKEMRFVEVAFIEGYKKLMRVMGVT
jgi:hypothetical protein